MISDPLMRILPTNMKKKNKAYMSYVICNFAHNFGKIESIFISLLFFCMCVRKFYLSVIQCKCLCITSLDKFQK